MMQCDVAAELMSALLDGALAPEGRADLDAHLRDCAHCRLGLGELRGQDRELRRALSAERIAAAGFVAQLKARLIPPAVPAPGRCTLLVVDDDPHVLRAAAGLLADEFDVLTADCAAAAEALFARQEIDIILTDQKMKRRSGVQLLEWVCWHHPRTVRLLMTAFAELEDAVDAINRGGVLRYIFKPWQPDDLLDAVRSAARTHHLERGNRHLLDELKRLNADLEQRVADRTRELEEANVEIEQKNKMLEKLALTDPLTGLPNRRAMDRLAEWELRRRDRYPGPLAVGIIDVDHFKQINTHYLLPAGDQVLVDLSRVLQESLRTVDLLGRIGGEEFLVIAPETNLKGAAVLGERIRERVEGHAFRYQEHQIAVTVSLGFAVAETGVPAGYEQMRHLAAAALAEAKSAGRNRAELRPLQAPVAG
jgi:diguanylate cyclase (GGDEF)-like protein